MKTHANDRVEAVLNGKKYQTEFDGVLPGVTLPVGVDTTDPDYNQQVVWIGDTPLRQPGFMVNPGTFSQPSPAASGRGVQK